MSNDNTTIGVIEIRKARNGWIVTAIEAHYARGTSDWQPRGYCTYTVQSNTPTEIAKVIAQVFKDYPVTEEVPVQPARKLP